MKVLWYNVRAHQYILDDFPRFVGQSRLVFMPIPNEFLMGPVANAQEEKLQSKNFANGVYGFFEGSGQRQ